MFRPALALLALAAPLHAQDSDVIPSQDLDEFDYGIICYYADTAPDIPLTDAEVDTYFETGSEILIIRPTRTLEIPAIEGIDFGVVSSVPEGVELSAATVLTRTDPSGATIIETFPLEIGSDLAVDAWNLDSADGPFEGTYRFETQSNGDVLYDVTFTVVAPDDYAGPLPECVARP